MPEPRTVSVKYIFLDVVRYSQERSVEAQTDIIATLNEIVRGSAKDVTMSEEKTIYLPTGDGICVAHFDPEAEYDIHLQFAFKLLERLDAYNAQTPDQMRKFQARIGINSNVDNLVVDINGGRNLAGAGINLAQRVMDTAGGNQIFVGNAVYETLQHRERYMKSFRSFAARGKHEVAFKVHQFVEPRPGLDISTPAQFVTTEKKEAELTKLAAYYFAHAIQHREQLMSLPRRPGLWWWPATVLLTVLATDSVGFSEATEITPYRPSTWGAGSASFDDQLKYYGGLDSWVLQQLGTTLEGKELAAYREYFDHSGYLYTVHFITSQGEEKIKREWPSIWKEFGFDTTIRIKS